MKKKIDKYIREKFINPVLHSRAPVSEVSLGVAVGIFMGFTPTVGVQMYLVAIVWTIYRYVFGKHFNLPVGVAMVWISNPLTMVPMSYLFLVTGFQGGRIVLQVHLRLQNTFAIFFEHHCNFQNLLPPQKQWIHQDWKN